MDYLLSVLITAGLGLLWLCFWPIRTKCPKCGKFTARMSPLYRVVHVRCGNCGFDWREVR